MSKPPRKYPPIYPGKVLVQEHMEPLGLTKYRLAKETGLTPMRIGGIVAGKRAITAETALRLAKFFGTSAEYWMNLQTHYDLEVARDAMAIRKPTKKAEPKTTPKPRRKIA